MTFLCLSIQQLTACDISAGPQQAIMTEAELVLDTNIVSYLMKGGWGERRRRELETTLRNFVVVPYDHKIARCYGQLVADRQR